MALQGASIESSDPFQSSVQGLFKCYVFFLHTLVGLSSSVQLLLQGFTETQPGGSVMPRPLPTRGCVQLFFEIVQRGCLLKGSFLIPALL